MTKRLIALLFFQSQPKILILQFYSVSSPLLIASEMIPQSVCIQPAEGETQNNIQLEQPAISRESLSQTTQEESTANIPGITADNEPSVSTNRPTGERSSLYPI